MKIALFVSILDQPGGAEIGTRRLAERLAQRGHNITIVTTQPMSRWQKQRRIVDYAKDVRVIRLPVWQRSRHIFACMLIVEALGSFPLLLRGIQILHMRGLSRETIKLAHIARRRGMKTLCVPMASGAYGDVATLPGSTQRDVRAFDRMSALTEPLRAEMIAWGFPLETTCVIPNGVDTDLFRPPQQPVRAPRVIFVGQFRPEKRVDLLLEAWQQVQRDCPQANLTLVGGGQQSPQYENLAARLGVTVKFIPNTDTAGVLAYLQASTIFVMPGISEGMSNALLEAMAVGLAPLVSDTPANRAVITPEVDGLVYDADSPQMLAAQIQRLIADAELRQRLGKLARQTIEQRFTLDAATDHYLALYASLLGESR